MGLNKDPYDFVFFNGDMFDYQEDEQQIIDHLLIPPATQPSHPRKPFIFTRGNHETRGKFRRELGNYFDGPLCSSPNMGARAFHRAGYRGG